MRIRQLINVGASLLSTPAISGCRSLRRNGSRVSTMNSSKLKRWRETEEAAAFDLRKQITSSGKALELKEFYPEFKLNADYTTSLEPYCPVWGQLPFFKKLIVGITPYLKDEEAFQRWYGVTPAQLLRLNELGRVEIRINEPRAKSTVPGYLDCFFCHHFPSSVRNRYYTDAVLGDDHAESLREQFRGALGRDFNRAKSIDTLPDDRSRAFRTAETAFLQLHALGYADKARQFEEMCAKDLDAAFTWLELCRLFLIGPVHYSMGGIHSVAQNATDKLRQSSLEAPR